MDSEPLMTFKSHVDGKNADVAIYVDRIELSLIHISEPTRLLSISYAVFCLKKKNKKKYP